MTDIAFTDVIKCELLKAEASDLAAVNAARLSFDSEHDEFQKADAGLIKYLVKNRHGSPFEHGYFKFRLEVPIAEFRDHVRHRAGHSYNEMSGRYTVLEPKFYVPARARTQHGKAGAYYFEEEPEDSQLTEDMQEDIKEAYRTCWDIYESMLENGVAKEQARLVLPVGIYTKVIWSVNPRSLMHFLSLRNHPTAMKEIQVVAQAAEDALRNYMPVTHQAFLDNERTSP